MDTLQQLRCSASELLGQTAHIHPADGKLSATGCGAEAAIGQLTRLTSLHLSIDRRAPSEHVPPEEMPPSLQRLTQQQRSMHGPAPLQLRQLGCSGLRHRGGGSQCNSSNSSNEAAADSTLRNTSLQELSLECMGPLSDDELAAAAGAMPDLRRLDVVGCTVVNTRWLVYLEPGWRHLAPAGGCGTSRCGTVPN